MKRIAVLYNYRVSDNGKGEVNYHRGGTKMKKKIIAILVSAAILLSGLFSAIYALNGQGSNIASSETEIIYDPVTELRKTTKTEDGLDFSDAAFKAQIKYYTSVFADAKNYSISSGVNTIGGTSVGGPANWHRYCAYTSDALSTSYFRI